MAAAAKKSGKFDYDRKIAGLEAVDRYTLRIRLKDTDYNLPYVLAHEPTSAVAREVIEAYAESRRPRAWPTRSAPARTGWRSGCARRRSCSRRNPDYRGFTWDFNAGATRPTRSSSRR